MSTTTKFPITTHVQYRYPLNDNKPYCVIDSLEGFKRKWVELSPTDKSDFLKAYNDCRYNPSRNALVPRSKTNLTLDQFEKIITFFL